jgi:hypothetical protein
MRFRCIPPLQWRQLCSAKATNIPGQTMGLSTVECGKWRSWRIVSQFIRRWTIFMDVKKIRSAKFFSHMLKGGGVIFSIFSPVFYSTLLHLPPLRFHCVGGWLGSNPGQSRLQHRLSDALTTRLDLISYMHGRRNYKSPSPKCRLYWRLIEVIDWRYSHSCRYFRPALWSIALLAFSLVSSHLPSSLCE